MADGTLFGRVRGCRAVDLFAGAGGASHGIRLATGFEPIVAINHCAHAIEIHALNHPTTEHYQESVFDVQPLTASRGRSVDLLWASPDCTHHSRAKGGKPREKGIRGLAWMVLRWAKEVRPTRIALENVPEFADWGPLTCRRKRKNPKLNAKGEIVETHRGGHPVKAKKGETFRLFVSHLRALGYAVDWRVLSAADYGTPTSRRRLFLVARCDGLPLVWPGPTHGPGRKPHLSAASCIDWSIPMLSIFATREEAKAWAKATGADGIPNRPLAPATERRIAEGVKRYVLEAAAPFLLQFSHGGRLHPLTSPAPTVTAGPVGGDMNIVVPIVAKARSNGSDTPRSGVWSAGAPMPTTTTTEQHALVTAWLAKHYGGVVGSDLARPLGTVTGVDHHSLVAATMLRTDMQSDGRLRGVASPNEPLRTVTTTGGHALVTATLVTTGHGEAPGQRPRCQDVQAPLGTVVATGNNHGLAAVFLDKLHGSALAGQSVTEPMPTVAAGGGKGGGHAALVAAFMCRYFGTGGQWSGAGDPMPTVTAREGLALCTVTINGEPWVIVDIAMRMLQPHELARAQGFPDSYIFRGSKGQKIERIGNSVCPPVAEAIVRSLMAAG